MAYRDYPDYDRERLYDDSDAYAVTAGFGEYLANAAFFCGSSLARGLTLPCSSS